MMVVVEDNGTIETKVVMVEVECGGSGDNVWLRWRLWCGKERMVIGSFVEGNMYRWKDATLEGNADARRQKLRKRERKLHLPLLYLSPY